MKTMSERAARSKNIKACLNRGIEIKARIKTIELERMAIMAASQKAASLETAWMQSINYHCQEFVRDLSARSSDGRIPHIKFDSPSAGVFINREKWIAAIPSLVAKCSSGSSGDDAECNRRLGDIATELGKLNHELNELGVCH